MTSSSAEQEVAAALQSFVEVAEDPDPRRRAEMYTSDTTLAMPGVVVQGDEQLILSLESTPVLRSVSFTPRAIDVDGRLASIYGVFQGVTGTAEEPTTMLFLIVLRKEDDERWRIVREFLAPE
jgi:ketosteroid isomerase-like protein